MSGDLTVEPLDSYYCDEDFLDCSAGWNEVDLDKKRDENQDAAPLKYIRVLIWDGANPTLLAEGRTLSTGHYSISFNQTPSCTGRDVRIQVLFERTHETQYPSKYRFAMEDHSGLIWSYMSAVKTFSGSSLGWDRVFSDAIATNTNKVANVYYTVNSAVTTMAGWSSNLDNAFAGTLGISTLRVVCALTPNTPTGCPAAGCAWQQYDGGAADLIALNDYLYNVGSRIRHELGHVAHFVMHHHEHRWGCQSENLNGSAGYGHLHCDWGSYAMHEGLPTFFGTRSLTTSNQAFECVCADNLNQGICSETADDGATTSDVDRIVSCLSSPAGTYDFRGIGDVYSSLTTHCSRLTGC